CVAVLTAASADDAGPETARDLYDLERTLERLRANLGEELADEDGAGTEGPRAPKHLGYFEMVGLRVRHAFRLRAYRPRRTIADTALRAEDTCLARDARIEAFLAVLGVQEISDVEPRSGYQGGLLDTGRELIRRKKPKKSS